MDKIDTTSRLAVAVEEIAQAVSDGHYTILRFTNGYKGAFGTPERLMPELPLEDMPIAGMPTFQTLEMLLKNMVKFRPVFGDARAN